MDLYEKMLISRKKVFSFITEEKEFSLKKLLDAIKQNGGVFRISPTITIKMYLNSLENEGIIKYESDKKLYLSNYNSE